MPQSKIDKIITAHFPKFGSKQLRKLRMYFGDFGKALKVSSVDLKRSGISMSHISDFLEWRKRVNVPLIIETLNTNSIRLAFLDDEGYPQLLKESSDPPEVLFIRGTIAEGHYLSFVGSRKYSQYGNICVQLLIPDAVRSGCVTVSGLALGIDGLVHKKTIENGGRTVAVLGSGIDDASIYPRSHAWLADRVLESGGALISEYPPGTGARKEHFPQRNRIIAGLSLATIVIEAGQRSGSLITARLALEENRDVFAVPGPITRQTSSGTNQLLKAGAIPCTDFASVLDGLSLDPQEMRSENEKTLPLSLEERELMRALETEKHVDELAEIMEADSASIGAMLSSLELRGAVTHLGSQRWATNKGLP